MNNSSINVHEGAYGISRGGRGSQIDDDGWPDV